MWRARRLQSAARLPPSFQWISAEMNVYCHSGMPKFTIAML